QPPRGQQAAAQHLGVLVARLQQRGDVALGHDQKVHGGLGIDVLEGHDVVVLVDDVGRALTGGDATEHAIGHRASGGLYNTAFVETSTEEEESRWAPVPNASSAFARTATT